MIIMIKINTIITMVTMNMIIITSIMMVVLMILVGVYKEKMKIYDILINHGD